MTQTTNNVTVVPWTIRKYTADDLGQMVDGVEVYMKESPVYKDLPFNRAYVRAILISELLNEDFLGLVAVVDGKVIGGLAARLTHYPICREKFAEVWLLFIHKEHRDPFLAKRLVNTYFDWAKGKGVRQVKLETDSGLETARFGTFAKRLGFELIGNVYCKENKDNG